MHQHTQFQLHVLYQDHCYPQLTAFALFSTQFQNVQSQGFGGGVSVSVCCTGCGINGAMFETHVNEPGNTNAVSKCVQVAFDYCRVYMATKF